MIGVTIMKIMENQFKIDDLYLSELFQEIISKNVNKSIHNYFNKRNDTFSEIFIPFLNYTYYRLHSFFDEIPMDEQQYISSKSSLTQGTLEFIHNKLFHIAHKTLISELYISKVTNELQGTTPEERYSYFNQNILGNSERFLELMDTYPVLFRILTEEVYRTVNYIQEIIFNYLSDYHEIKDIVGSDFLQLENIESGVGDSHQNGKAVAILRFSSNERIVYKPRSLAVDKNFSEMIKWINNKGALHQFHTPKTLNKETHGWVEFVQNSECSSIDELQRYHYRLGGYLALSYVLSSTDFHLENLIAVGEHPMLIDLETLFSNDLDNYEETFPFPALVNEFKRSVFGTLMLPISFPREALLDIDVSALGGEEGKKSKKVKVWQLINRNTDEMKLVQKPYASSGSHNKPIYQGKKIDATDFTKNISEGFRSMYELFLVNKEELKTDNGPIYAFFNNEIRHVFRATHVYGKFLEASLHPDYLQEIPSREKLFDYSWNMTSLIKDYKYIVPSEISDLMKNDIPYFTLSCGGTSLYNSEGKETPNFFKKSCIEITLEKLTELSILDLKRQTKYIEMSLSTLTKPKWGFPINKETKMTQNISASSKQDLLLEAKKIGDTILDQVIWEKQRKAAYLIGVCAGANEEITVAPLNADLYDGNVGVSIFMAQLSIQTGEEKYREIAMALIQGAFLLLKPATLTSSAYYGLSSFCYGLLHLGVLWEDESLISNSYAYLNELEELLIYEKATDYIGGLAGVIVVTLNMYLFNENQKALFIAQKSGQLLVEKLEDSKDPMLSGFSHGAAGYSLALIMLGKITNDTTMLREGIRFLKYERTLFNPHVNSWKDLRERSGDVSPTYWCHGAPGIGISRLSLLKFYQDDELHEEIELTLIKTIQDGFGLSHCLCHGDFGNLDLLLSYSEQFGNNEVMKKAHTIALQSVERAKKDEWALGLNQTKHIYGMMLGLSGVGYGLLRTYDPTIPSILSLQLPSTKSREESEVIINGSKAKNKA